ncbi:hypothetical protein QQF54_00225 [Lelliottia sp. V106_10]|uniref:hypothetical protein n=1 Tax=Lelliottia wanjuensis TaxID=3050585 RepID=UPI00254A6B5E|nr:MULTISPECIES: hypothetical protein [unclassified Lelliottia]MDK9355124.1 hypothetical protein [Lelliottia sp. V106_16]MDK9371794.1 hypothetical protein [Lelliottia sp. V106_10]MDK9598969.1 hypothetical protein [Lelliottia sp. V106_5]
MKFITLLFCMIYSIAICHASEFEIAMESCLYQKSTQQSVKYKNIDMAQIYVSDNYNDLGGASYIKYLGGDLGYAEKKSTGMIFYKKNRYSLSKAHSLNNYNIKFNQPRRFEFLLSEWGSVSINGRDYICVNFPFEGVGESGDFQKIRNVFLFDIKGRDLFYSVKNTAE